MQDIYNSLQEAQSEILSEIIYMREIEYHHFRSKENDKKIFFLLNKLQNYYDIQTILSIASHKVEFDKDFFDFLLNFIQPLLKENDKFDLNVGDDKYSDNFELEKLREIIGRLECNSNNTKVDVLTYSIIPSKFHFFIYNKNDVKDFIDFIQKLPEEKRYIFSRSIFIQPDIIEFTSSVFYKVFEPYFYQERLIESLNNETLFNQIIKRFEKKIHLFPNSTKAFLSQIQKTEKIFFEKCYLNEICQLPEKFLIFHEWHRDTFKHFEDLRTKLKEIILDRRFIDKALEIITKTSLDKKNNKYIDKSIISENFLFSSLSEVVVNDGNLQGNYSMFYCPKKKANNFENQNTNNSFLTTQMKTDYPELLLRQLLKQAPIMQKNLKVSFRDIFEIIEFFLVRRCNHLNKSSSEYIYFRLKSILERNKINKRNLDKMKELISKSKKISHEQERKAYKTQYRASKMIEDLNKTIPSLNQKLSFLLIEKIINYYFQIDKNKDLFNSLSDPKLSVSNFVKIFNVIDLTQKVPISEFSYTVQRLLFHRFAKSIRYEDYLQTNYSLQIYDDNLHNFRINSFSHIFSSLKVESEHQKNDKAFKEVYCLSQYKKCMKDFMKAFTINSDPLAKFELINQSISKSFLLLRAKYPPGVIGEDDNIILFEFLFTFFPSPFLFSNLAYLYKYYISFLNVDNKLDDHLSQKHFQLMEEYLKKEFTIAKQQPKFDQLHNLIYQKEYSQQ